MLSNIKMMISMFHSNPSDRLYQNGEANNNQFNACKCFSFGP